MRRICVSTATRRMWYSTAAATKAKVDEVKKAPYADFVKIIGASGTNQIIQCGEHIRVYNDNNIFAWIVMDRAGSSAAIFNDKFSLPDSFHFYNLSTKVRHHSME